MSFINKIKGVMQKMAADTGLGKEFKSIFEISGVPAFQQFYNFCVLPCKCVYRGFYNAWHLVPAPTIKNDKATRQLFRTNIAKASVAELAGLIWSEQCTINVNLKGFKPTDAEPVDKAQRFIDSVLNKNNFGVKMQEGIEQMLALGGLALKVWFEDSRDSSGNVVPGEGKIKIGYCMADQFIPTAWDNAGITEGVFISRIAKDGYYYTRLEWHKWNGKTYYITNELYRSAQKNAAKEPQDILGYRYPLNIIYPFLDEEAAIDGLETSLFSYARTPIANNVDDNSPLGISMYANAMETLHAIDICYDSFVREFRLGKKRIIVPARCVKVVADPETGAPRRYFDATDETYEALATDDVDNLKIIDNSVELRVEEHVAALNAFLSILCLQLGFSASTFSFDASNGMKTATEVVSENSKTYKTIKSCQNMIEPAIKTLIYNIFALACLYDVEFEGEKVSDWFSKGSSLEQQYQCTLFWDDAIIQDRQTNINEGINLVSNSLMSKKTFLTERLGMTDEQAEAELQAIAEEGQVNSFTIDRFNTFSAG